MNPQQQFCPNFDCPARGQRGKSNIGIHSLKRRRYICHECGQTFSARQNSVLYRLHTDPQLVLIVLALLAYGCPIPAVVKVYHLDPRTVRAWWHKAGKHCQTFHQRLLERTHLDLGQVQADEIKIKLQRGVRVWMGLVLRVSTRLWLGGAVDPVRGEDLARALANQVRQIALCRPLLMAVDGWQAYLGAFRRAFRDRLPRDRATGRSVLREWPELAIVQVIKPHTLGETIQRRMIQGTARVVQDLISRSQGGGQINTAYIERLNASFRQRLAALARQTRHLAQLTESVAAGMWVVGCVYNFCDPQQSLRLQLSVGEHGYHWVERTPALASGLADHVWSVEELLATPVPPPRWKPQFGRGRPSNQLREQIRKWA